ASGPRTGQAIRQRHGVELSLEKLRNNPGAKPSAAELLLGRIAAETARVAASLSTRGRDRLVEQLRTSLSGQNTLIPTFHLMRTAMLQRSRDFTVTFSGLEDATPHDLLLHRDRIEAEIACDVVTAEDGRGVHRGAWFRLADRIDPDLQTWLAAHPGRYLLKMTLPLGLRGGLHDGEPDSDTLSQLHHRIRAMLETSARHDHDEAIVLRLDPLLLAGAQAEDIGLISSLRREFGPEAHLSVTTAGNGIFVMAARAGQENEVAVAIRRRLATLAPTRLTGERPGILSVFVEDTDRLEWRGLRDRLELEGETRQFMTDPAGRPVVAISFVSRLELFGIAEPDAAPGGELRFRNPRHPAAGFAALAPAVMSSV
ncbi:MAG TPA: hypothetical protein VHX39_25630, partial [Acetobacteraceae bacterium]|nr:hypothetical protein [Acetobacteraceae bacterium]